MSSRFPPPTRARQARLRPSLVVASSAPPSSSPPSSPAPPSELDPSPASPRHVTRIGQAAIRFEAVGEVRVELLARAAEHALLRVLRQHAEISSTFRIAPCTGRRGARGVRRHAPACDVRAQTTLMASSSHIGSSARAPVHGVREATQSVIALQLDVALHALVGAAHASIGASAAGRRRRLDGRDVGGGVVVVAGSGGERDRQGHDCDPQHNETAHAWAIAGARRERRKQRGGGDPRALYGWSSCFISSSSCFCSEPAAPPGSVGMPGRPREMMPTRLLSESATMTA